jgi:hypothetical protein
VLLFIILPLRNGKATDSSVDTDRPSVFHLANGTESADHYPARAAGAAKPDSTGRPRPVAPLPATSFEELLKQMQAQNQPGSPSLSAEEKTPAGRPLPREVASPAYTKEKTELPARSLERPTTPRSLEAPAHDARRASTLPRATNRPAASPDYWQQEATRRQTMSRAEQGRSLSEQLRNPADLRNAFILSEILQRKF